MRAHRDWSLWLAVGILGAVLATGPAVAGPVPQAPPDEASASEATTIPVVPAVLVGPRQGPARPPVVHPVVRSTPARRGPVTYEGVLPQNLGVSIPALQVMGTGDVKIEGDLVSLRVSGDGTFWIDKGSSVSLDSKTTGTITDAGAMYKFVGFSGTARVSGENLQARIQGARLIVIAEGQGNATMSGEGGMFRLTQKGGRLVLGSLEENPITKDFEQVTPSAGGGVVKAGKAGIPPAGLIPAEKPEQRVYEVPKLPSEGGPRAAPPPGGPAAPAAPTTK